MTALSIITLKENFQISIDDILQEEMNNLWKTATLLKKAAFYYLGKIGQHNYECDELVKKKHLSLDKKQNSWQTLSKFYVQLKENCKQFWHSWCLQNVWWTKMPQEIQTCMDKLRIHKHMF